LKATELTAAGRYLLECCYPDGEPPAFGRHSYNFRVRKLTRFLN